MGRTLGLILVGGAVLICLLLALVIYIPAFEGETPDRSVGAATLGFALFSVVWLIPLAAGVFMLWKGSQEAARAGRASNRRYACSRRCRF